MNTRKSARVLGKKYKLTDQEMNFILKEEGFLDGEPGHYTVTEKGEKFAADGKTSYGRTNGDWTTRTWDDGIADELHVTPRRKKQIQRALKAARQKARVSKKSEDAGLAIQDYRSDNEEAITTDASNDALVEAVSELLVAASAYGVYKALPYIKRWWSEKAVPSLEKTKSRVIEKTGKDR